MSHNTITHHEAPSLRGVSPRWIGGMVLVLALGLGLGYLISNITTGDEAVAPAISETMALEEFVRLNTIDLDYLAPAAVADPFMDMNVTSYAALIDHYLAPKGVTPAFWEVNTSYAGLNEGVMATKALAPGFWERNTDMNYELVQPYTEPDFGPR